MYSNWFSQSVMMGGVLLTIKILCCLFKKDNPPEAHEVDHGEEEHDETIVEPTGDVSPSPSASPFETWVMKNPYFRKAEIDYLRNANLGFDTTITNSGELRQPFTIDKWTFLLVLDKSFPRKTETSEIPIKVYFVVPSITDLSNMYGIKQEEIPSVSVDLDGEAYLNFEITNQELTQYLNGQHDRLMTESIILHTKEWYRYMLRLIETKKEKRSNSQYVQIIPNPRSINRPISSWESYEKYVDGRASRSSYVNPRCKKVVLSDRALIQIINESQSKIDTETGGLFLGHFEKGVWYVIEASDPGIAGIFRVAYHESDDVYQNHVCDVISRTYKNPLVFLGMWHRHPGSFDKFSSTDDRTNFKYARSVNNGCISALINYDPDFRITFYYAEIQEEDQVSYTQVDFEVGDDKISNKEMMALASNAEIISRLRQGGKHNE
ncbi:MAG: Mov34/MPN/PAD-1 family protein [Anaerolineaceae bacterium]|nr:Mov34/MPN/PAD-1 family protein [Anaerolineaceae bacterium]